MVPAPSVDLDWQAYDARVVGRTGWQFGASAGTCTLLPALPRPCSTFSASEAKWSARWALHPRRLVWTSALLLSYVRVKMESCWRVALHASVLQTGRFAGSVAGQMGWPAGLAPAWFAPQAKALLLSYGHIWSPRPGMIWRPSVYETGALPTELRGQRECRQPQGLHGRAVAYCTEIR